MHVDVVPARKGPPDTVRRYDRSPRRLLLSEVAAARAAAAFQRAHQIALIPSAP